jgi:hypothetical protein
MEANYSTLGPVWPSENKTEKAVSFQDFHGVTILLFFAFRTLENGWSI